MVSAALLLTVLIAAPALLATAAQGVEALPRTDTVYAVAMVGSVVDSWNMFNPTYERMTYLLYLPLFQYNGMQDVWLPLIAEKYEVVSPTKIRVYIRPEARWSDGKPITAEDVVFTYETAQRLGLGPGAGCNNYIESVKAVSDKVVEFTAKQPVNYFSFIGCALGIRPQPKHVMEPLLAQGEDKLKQWKNNDPEKQVVSGPYKVAFYDQTKVVYERLDDWWGKDVFGLPAPKYVVSAYYKDNAAATLALQKGEVDWAGLFIPKVWTLFDKGVGTFYKDKPYFIGYATDVLYINYKKKALSHPELRRAIAYAIPYKDMLEKAYFGYGVQASMSLVIDTFPAYAKWIDRELAQRYWGSPDARPPTDLEKAKEILDKAGIVDRDGDGCRELPDGTPLKGLKIEVPYGWTDWMTMIDMIASNLREIGICVETNYPDFQVWWSKIVNGDYDMVIGWGAGFIGYDHPWNAYRGVLDPRLKAPTGNWENYKNEEVVELIDKAAATLDPEERARIYSRLQEIVYRDVPVVALFYGAHWYEYNTKYWVGWPNEDNPYWYPVAPWDENAFPVLFGIARKGETPRVPAWMKPVTEGGLLVPTSMVMDDLLRKAKEEAEKTVTPVETATTPAAPGAAKTVTVTQTTTTTVTKTQATATTVTTTTTVTAPDWAVTGIVGIILLVIGLAIGYYMKRS